LLRSRSVDNRLRSLLANLRGLLALRGQRIVEPLRVVRPVERD
jgi:hypothetical protein